MSVAASFSQLGATTFGAAQAVQSAIGGVGVGALGLAIGISALDDDDLPTETATSTGTR